GLGFGRGRLDALEAVQAAQNYTHDERDLMVRNFKDDNGKNNVAAQEVESFDLWVRNDAASPAATPYDQCPHQTPEITVDPAIHIGIGRNDLQVSGTCTSMAEVTFVIEIDGTAAPDTFKWSRNGAPPTANVAITGAVQALSDGVSIQFANTTMHTLGDKWMVRARQIVNRFAHIRVRNRGNQDFFTRSGFPHASSMNALDVARRRLMLCVSDGYPVARYVSVAAMPGPNDLEVTSAYTGAAARSLFTIEITATAAAGDTFTWYRDGVVKPVVVIAAGMEHVLEAGVKIRFGSHTGHQIGDRWNLYARSGADAFLNLDHYWDSDVPPVMAPFPAELFDPASGRAGTRVVFADAVDALAAGASEIRTAMWPEALRPPTNNPNAMRPLPAHKRRFFLLGETVPHDGALMGFTAKTNNNITFREIAFAKFRFSQDDGAAPLDSAIDVDNTGIATAKAFRVEVRTTCGTFRAESVRLRFTGRKGAAPEEKGVFHHTAGMWQWDSLILWATADAPLEARRPDGSQPAATGEQFDLSFECLVTLDKSFTEVIIEAEIVSEFRNHPAAAGKHTFSIFQMAPLPLGTGAAKAAILPRPASFVFADMAPLSQTAQQTFGPVVDPMDANATMNRYRATALFTSASEVKAYAVTNGLVAIQRDPANNDTVNLFLRPLRQPVARLTPVKYFVYRGLKLTDWLRGSSAADAKFIRDEAGSPPFLASVWQAFKAQNPGVPDMPSTVFGYDDAQPGTDLLDDIFFRVGATMQLPLAVEGMELGKFDHTKPFGFEIVIEEGDYAPTLDYARKASYEIDITMLPNGFARRIKQEEILNFIDPAAFYGLHMHPGGLVRAPASVTHKGQDVYTNVVSKFLTKNRLYIDIRNENGGSLNFQRNYDAGGNQLQRGLTAGALTAQPYATSGWPIVSFDNNTFANTPNDYNEIHLRLPRNDNENPVLYLAHGQLLADSDTPFLRDAVLNDAGSWTKTVSLRVPNTGANPTKVAAAWILRLFYGRLDVANRTVAIPNTVLQTLKYTDNVFGPIDRAPKWKGTQGIKWVTTQDNRYVDGMTERGWRQMMQSGLAVQTSGTPRVLLYAIATARDLDPDAEIDFAPVRSMPAGVSDKSSFFLEPGLFGVYQLEIDQTQDGANIVRTLQLQQAPKDGYSPSSALLLGLTQVEFDALLALGPGLDKVLRTLILDTKTAVADPNRPADRYRLGVQGLRTADGQFESVFPTAGNEIFVYTVDGQLFASKAFAAAEPLPTAYARNYEESLGARDWPQRERQIAAVTTVAPKTITIKNYDWTDEVLPGGKIRIGKSAMQDGQKDVTNVQFNGTDTIITVTGTLNSTAPLGSAFTLVRKFEDRMIDLDQGAALSGIQKTRTLVDGFVTAVAGIANNAGAKAAIQTRIDNEGVKILGRARARAQADRPRADDHERTLYWARNRLVVAVKSHPFCLASISARNELLLRLEKKSRGYEPDFSGAGGSRKVLITGFDPFMLDTQLDRSNPSAAVALALHGATINGMTKNAFVQSAILPLRYRDFDAGRIEELVMPRLSGAGKVDMILTISQNADEPFYVLERFASRLRGGFYDNERVIKKPQALAAGNEFYETTLPAGNMVPGPFATPPDDEQTLFFNQSFKSTTMSFRPAVEATAPGENTNTSTGTLAAITGTALEGSGGQYFANELMYRVARERDKPPASTTVTGHFHIPSPSAAKVGIADVIAEVETMVKRWLDGLP
ncbi:MAG TPA: hypothetical protein VEU30_07300, partial [Thermoanaerobaculia bacterium]|nr:hypothetical protein [Thermoanaerobaculia bacterium]